MCVCVPTYVRTCMCERGGIPRQGVENLILELNKERDVCVCVRERERERFLGGELDIKNSIYTLD